MIHADYHPSPCCTARAKTPGTSPPLIVRNFIRWARLLTRASTAPPWTPAFSASWNKGWSPTGSTKWKRRTRAGRGDWSRPILLGSAGKLCPNFFIAPCYPNRESLTYQGPIGTRLLPRRDEALPPMRTFILQFLYPLVRAAAGLCAGGPLRKPTSSILLFERLPGRDPANRHRWHGAVRCHPVSRRVGTAVRRCVG
jgi:hypothetical protein